MDYQEKTVLLKNGRTCLLRAPVEGDAEMMLDYLMTTSAETPYMIREPEEVRTDLEEEREFLRKAAEHPRRLMVSAYVEGQLAGTCSFAPASERNRMRHRCRVGISLYRAFWGLGIGTALMGEILAGAKTAGFEQAELEVISRVSRETIEKLPAYLDATTFETVPVERGFLLDIEIVCSRGADTATARIVQEHTNIILVEKNGTVLYHKDPQPELADTDSEHLSLRGIYDFVQSCDLADIAPLLERQIADNTAIAEVGLRGQYGAAIGTLLLGGGRATAKEKARAYASAGSDARMNGCEMPVVINS